MANLTVGYISNSDIFVFIINRGAECVKVAYLRR